MMANDKTTTLAPLAPVADAEVVVANLTNEQIDVVKNTICKGYTDTEMRLYLHQCEKLSLDPLARETYTFKAGGGIVIGTGIDGFRKRANDTGCYMPGRATEYEMDGDKLISARVYVKKFIKGEWHEFSEDAYLEEFKGKGQWNVMERVMLSKCAEVRALRRVFPRELGGLYEPAERAAIERNDRAPRIKDDSFAPPVDATAEPVEPDPVKVHPKRIVDNVRKELGLTGGDVAAVLKAQGAPEDSSVWTVKDVENICHALKARATTATTPGWYERIQIKAQELAPTDWAVRLDAAIVDSGHGDVAPQSITEEMADKIIDQVEKGLGM